MTTLYKEEVVDIAGEGADISVPVLALSCGLLAAMVLDLEAYIVLCILFSKRLTEHKARNRSPSLSMP